MSSLAVQPSSRRRAGAGPTGYTVDFTVGGMTGQLMAHAPNGQLREIHIRAGRYGSTLAGLLATVATSVSIGLRAGVPLAHYVDEFTGASFVPDGMTDDPDVRHATSVIDYVFQRLSRDFLP